MSIFVRHARKFGYFRRSIHSSPSAYDPNSVDKYASWKNEIFDIYKDTERGGIPTSFIFRTLTENGLRADHPRVRLLKENIARVFKISEDESMEDRILDRESFKECISPSIELLNSALQKKLIIPEWQTFTSDIADLYEQCKPITDGEVASYIPQLARSSSDLWGVAVCTVDGQRASWGNAKTDFCLQSVSKPFTYAIVADDCGADNVHKYVGQEPSGRLFNEICLDTENKPHNPMINAGAIIVTSLLKPDLKISERFGYVMDRIERFSAHGKLNFDNAVFLSERESADRNYALGYYMREYKCFPESVTDVVKFKDVLDLYFMLCSMETDAETLSVMAATLANGGVCPLSQERTVSHRSVRDTLTLMHSCGMYDYSGKFAFSVGIPSKSGVSGAMIMVIPNVLGIALYSPPLDSLGNSVRGVQFSQRMVEKFNFHNFDNIHYAEKIKVDPRRSRHHYQQQLSNLFFAVRDGDINGIKRYLLRGHKLNKTDYDDRTVLHIAASEGLPHILHYLLQHWPTDEIDIPDRYGETPMDNAIRFNHKKCAAHLVQFGRKKAT
ncbi:hypothetical protein L596_015952 [Steinernema carpocapsae]|uniref:glutaminase n=1 Tax=Steinernema carpocapsae TaxID=34508 RepID=A0A4U5NHH5_STECR|nr:hypothetical protein L596_015952 [Steinernema carpocapsae]